MKSERDEGTLQSLRYVCIKLAPYAVLAASAGAAVAAHSAITDVVGRNSPAAKATAFLGAAAAAIYTIAQGAGVCEEMNRSHGRQRWIR